ncbi:CWC26 [[Candida] subhashii]|uniref:Pre-mRNA-splicing factor CWC26 n=1 Tax=[Candida] subhashii TaxID=561895 RepID=A0A8J5QIP5_9ASCO|nr:CWC26 [[Candida] subhashii]KAG7662773.1 CWC26 [[Candida] subhashii]
MSRADYLSKYLNSSSQEDNNNKKQKKKKKSKKHEISTLESNIIVEKPDYHQLEDNGNEEILEDIESSEYNEHMPVKVDIPTKKINRGFKRIDTGTTVDSSLTHPSKEQKVQQETVYRDSSGRIIDIEARKAQFEADKLQQEESKKVTEIRSTPEEQIRQEKQSFKQKLSNFEDPLLSFQDEKKEVFEDANFSKFVYNKGINPPNRFGIPAGYFWDGIDRSNGFEELMMRKQTETSFKKLDSSINETYELDYD